VQVDAAPDVALLDHREEPLRDIKVRAGHQERDREDEPCMLKIHVTPAESLEQDERVSRRPPSIAGYWRPALGSTTTAPAHGSTRRRSVEVVAERAGPRG